jgi:hypothetical protein
MIHGIWLTISLCWEQTTSALRKTWPKERKYEFWNIQMCLCVLQDSKVDQAKRNLLGTLAYRMLQKMVNDMPQDQVRRRMRLFGDS